MGNVTELHPKIDLVKAVRKAIADMDWLKPTDFAMVTLAEFYAKQIEEADNPARAAETIGLRLENAIKALGGTPLQRKAITGAEKQITGRLAQLRAQRKEEGTA